MTNSDSSVNEVFSLIDEHRIYEFAKLYAQKHKDFADAFRKHFAKDLLSTKKVLTIEDIKKMVDKCFTHQYGGPKWSRSRYGYEPDCLDWEAVGVDLEKVVNLFSGLVDKKQPMLAIEGSLYLIEQVSRSYDEEYCYDREDIDIDDIHIDDALGIICSAFESPDVNTQYKLNTVAKLEEISHYEVFDCINFDVPAFIENMRNLHMTDDERIALREEAFRNAKDKYDKESKASDLWDYLMSLNRPQQAIDLYLRNRNFHDLRSRYIEYLLKNNQLTEALSSINEGIRSAREYTGIIMDWQRTKLEVLQKLGNESSVIEQLKLLFYEDSSKMKYYRQLKKLIPSDEWTAFLTDLLKKSKRDKISSVTLSEIYVAEKWYDKLYENLLTNSYNLLYALEEYAKYLSEEQQTTLVKRLEQDLRRSISSPKTRNGYRDFVSSLIKLRKTCLPGRVLADSIVAYCRQKYNNRPAMLDELKRYDK